MGINYNDEKIRYEQLMRSIPDVLKYKTLLYVGGHIFHDRNLQMTKYFRVAGYKIDVVEINEQNCVDMGNAYKWINKIYNEDIKMFDSFDTSYDITMFWHGIEHIERDELIPLIKNMKYYTNKYIIFACPNGRYEQEAEYGNENEIHLTHWYKEDFEKLALNYSVMGKQDQKNGNIIVWIKC